MIIPVSFLCSLIHKRLTCLSYGIPILYLVYKLILSMGSDYGLLRLPYTEFILLIGILHMVEGIMTILDAKKHSKCIIAYKGNNLVGGYQTYKRWCIPLFLFCFKEIYLPMLAVLVYADETFTMVPEKKTVLMGRCILTYGVVTGVLGYLCMRTSFPLAIGILCMPLLHEGLFIINKRIENKEYLYSYPPRGIRIIEIKQTENSKKLFNRGDIILKVNHQDVNTTDEYYHMLENSKARVYVELHTREGKNKYVICSTEDIKEAGIILLPEE